MKKIKIFIIIFYLSIQTVDAAQNNDIEIKKRDFIQTQDFNYQYGSAQYFISDYFKPVFTTIPSFDREDIFEHPFENPFVKMAGINVISYLTISNQLSEKGAIIGKISIAVPLIAGTVSYFLGYAEIERPKTKLRDILYPRYLEKFKVENDTIIMPDEEKCVQLLYYFAHYSRMKDFTSPIHTTEESLLDRYIYYKNKSDINNKFYNSKNDYYNLLSSASYEDIKDKGLLISLASLPWIMNPDFYPMAIFTFSLEIYLFLPKANGEIHPVTNAPLPKKENCPNEFSYQEMCFQRDNNLSYLLINMLSFTSGYLAYQNGNYLGLLPMVCSTYQIFNGNSFEHKLRESM